MDHPSSLCRFEHPGFAALGDLTFRLTRDDRVAAMALTVDNVDVVVPLRTMGQLLTIQPGSADGEMLRLVEEALRFVPSLRLGDKLPSEVLTGEASWEPRACHQQTAAAKLQMQLVAWLNGSNCPDDAHFTQQMLVAAAADPAIRPRVEESLRRAATQLGIEGGGDAVARLVEQAAEEFSYIEALREWLLDRVSLMTKRIVRIGQELPSIAAGRRETLVQVARLATAATIELTAQFELLDAQTTDILDALRDLDARKSGLRPLRDRLFSTLVTWQALLRSWDELPANLPQEAEGVWRVIDETYRFLAPRYMSVQEWQSYAAAANRSALTKSAVLW